MSTSTDAPRGKFRKFKWGIVLVIGLALLYALSSGPALMMAQRRMVPTGTVEAIYFAPYSPLQLAGDFIPGVDWLVMRYVELWDTMSPPPPQ